MRTHHWAHGPCFLTSSGLQTLMAATTGITEFRGGQSTLTSDTTTTTTANPTKPKLLASTTTESVFDSDSDTVGSTSEIGTLTTGSIIGDNW